jgi:DNA-binding GntR family transcriptional regulator
MPRKREDSFRVALEGLRDELRAGAHPMGARLTAGEIASRLRLSATPVRESLCHLAGEGLLHEHRGHGFFVPRLTERDVTSLLRLQLDLLLIACDAEEAPVIEVDRLLGAPFGAAQAPDPQRASERLLRALVAPTSPMLVRHLLRLQDQLAPFFARASEDTVVETSLLAAALSGRDLPEIRRTVRRVIQGRLETAPLLVRLRESETNIESI